MLKMTIADIEALMDRHFPESKRLWSITNLVENEVTLQMRFRPDLVRAGGTISGPAMMALADTVAYFVTLAHAGPLPHMATTNRDIHFLARPKPVDIIATARLAPRSPTRRVDGGDPVGRCRRRRRSRDGYVRVTGGVIGIARPRSLVAGAG